MDLEFSRPVPRFLQNHMHLLSGDRSGGAAAEETEEDRRRRAEEEAAEDRRDEEENVLAALQADPSLAEQHPELAGMRAKAEAAALKERGNELFKRGEVERAAIAYEEARGLDPTDPALASNHAAALLRLGDARAAIAAAGRATQLDAGWAKGWGRLGEALDADGDHPRASDAYRRAWDLEPANAAWGDKYARARGKAQNDLERGKVVFRRQEGRAASKEPRGRESRAAPKELRGPGVQGAKCEATGGAEDAAKKTGGGRQASAPSHDAPADAGDAAPAPKKLLLGLAVGSKRSAQAALGAAAVGPSTTPPGPKKAVALSFGDDDEEEEEE